MTMQIIINRLACAEKLKQTARNQYPLSPTTSEYWPRKTKPLVCTLLSKRVHDLEA